MAAMYLFQDVILGAVGLDDGFGFDDLIVFCAGATTVLTFFLLIGRLSFWKALKRTWHWLQKFQVDWDGLPGDAGHARVPGMMEWRRSITADVVAIKEEVVEVKETVRSMVSPTPGGGDNRINVERGEK